jgi:hypothetical protein
MDLKLKTGCDKGTNFDGGLLWKDLYSILVKI